MTPRLLIHNICADCTIKYTYNTHHDSKYQGNRQRKATNNKFHKFNNNISLQQLTETYRKILNEARR